MPGPVNGYGYIGAGVSFKNSPPDLFGGGIVGMGFVDGLAHNRGQAVAIFQQLRIHSRPFAAHGFDQALDVGHIRGQQSAAERDHDQSERERQRQDNKPHGNQ